MTPDDPATHELRYRAWRGAPQDPAFNDSARMLLLDPQRGGRTPQAHVALFEDYVEASGKRPKLSATELLGLTRRWIATRQHEAAERLLVQMAARQPAMPGLAEAHFELWLALRDHGGADARRRVGAAIERHFPQSPQAAKLRVAQE
jgi:hypothetical protein